MQVSACNPSAQPLGVRIRRRFGRREVFLDGATSICSENKSSASDPNERANASDSVSRSANSNVDLGEVICKNILPVTRRALLSGSAVYSYIHSSRYFPALALGDPSVTIEDVTPLVLPSGPLFPSEERIVELFEKNTYSVVNIFDVTLRPQLNVTGVVEWLEMLFQGIQALVKLLHE